MATTNLDGQNAAALILGIINAVAAQQAQGTTKPAEPAPATTAPVPLSPIDKALGGEALAGKKTLIAVVAYVILSILQSQDVVGTATGTPAPKQTATQTQTQTPAAGGGAAPAAAPATSTAPAQNAPAPAQATVSNAPPAGTKTPTGQIFTTLIAAFGGLGLLSKFDRLIQALAGAAES